MERWDSFCCLRDLSVKFSSFDELGNDIDAADELSTKEYLGEGWPLRIELKPLSNPLILEDVEVAEAVPRGGEKLQKPSSELTLWLLRGAFDKNQELRLLIDQTLYLLKGLLLLLLKPFGIEGLLLVHNLGQLFW